MDCFASLAMTFLRSQSQRSVTRNGCVPQSRRSRPSMRGVAAGFAQPLDLDHLALRQEARLGRRFLQHLVETRAFDFIGSPAALANQQNALMAMADMLARGIGVAALDLVQEAVLQEKVQRAI